jgi:hypothetical protein
LAFESAGSSSAAKVAMMAMTTSNSIRVNPFSVEMCGDTIFFYHGFTSQEIGIRRLVKSIGWLRL